MFTSVLHVAIILLSAKPTYFQGNGSSQTMYAEKVKGFSIKIKHLEIIYFCSNYCKIMQFISLQTATKRLQLLRLVET